MYTKEQGVQLSGLDAIVVCDSSVKIAELRDGIVG